METIIEIFDKYGWGGIIGLILCGAIFLAGKWLSNKLSDDMTTGLEKVGEKLTDQMSKQNDNLVNVLVNQQDKLLDTILNKENDQIIRHSEMIIDKIKISDEITIACKEIMLYHGAQRAFVIEFTNGTVNLSGVPFAKYSCTHEWHDKGMFSLTERCKALPFSQIAKVAIDILNSKNHIKIYKDMDEFAEENISFWTILNDHVKNIKSKTIVCSAMYDKDNTFMGMLCLEYTKDYEFTIEDINQLGVETAQVTSIVNLRYKYSEN